MLATLKALFRTNASSLLSMFLLVVLPLVGSSTVTYLLYEHQNLLRDLTLPQMLLYFGIMVLVLAFSLVHSTVAVLLTGFFLGWAGLPGTIIAYALAALLGYELATRLDQGKLLRFVHSFPKAEAIMQELRHQSWQLILLVRLAPILPFALMTFVLAILGVDRTRFLGASVLGMLPRSLFFYWIGTQAQDALSLLHSPDTGTTGKVLVLVLLAVAALGLYYVFNRAVQRALNKQIEKQENY
ncbi:VTT domain-containing protein [Hymenobacter aerilatus]|uniref:TVP38/TMEM64 family membrane protein n=1 Tax=Hymenobacter aerilatus TaxID=2932251 RepID=A0A8T9SUV1_9BACT|nr:VTT domain-containing protein [Hymenobacter aerilatus]UOR05547.1 VTT domain-containing protein [Hymenobacter aerilatus]